MGVNAIGSTLKRKSVLVALSFTLVLFSMQAAWADNNATLTKLEKWLCFATFADESDESRVKRLEEKLFGDPNEGSIDERIAKLNAVWEQRQKEEDAAKSPVSTPSTPSTTGTPAAPSSGGSSDPSYNFGSSPSQPSGTSSSDSSSLQQRPGQSDADFAKERERVKVQAAREQEMNDLLKEGAGLWRNRHGAEAVDRFEQVLRLDPQNPEANFSIGVIQESQGKLKEAQGHYEMAARANPNNSDYMDAVTAIARKIRSAPVDPNKQMREKANEAFNRGDYITAVNLYKSLDDKTPQQASIKFSLGTTYLMMKDAFNALEYFKVAHQLEPNNEKYTKSFNTLAAEVNKTQAAQQQIENQYNGATTGTGTAPGSGWTGGAVTPPPVPISSSSGKGDKKSKDKNKSSSQNTAHASTQPQYPRQPQQQPMQQPMQQSMPQQGFGSYPQQPMQQQAYGGAYPQQRPPQQMQQPMQQYPNQGYGAPQQGGYPMAQQNPYSNAGYQGSQSYIPPDPQQYASGQSRPQQMQQQPMQQQPMQQQPMQQQRMPQQMPQQSMQQPMQQQNYGNGSSQNGFGQQMGSQPMGGQPMGTDYTPPPQAAPQGRFDPRLAQQLNNPNNNMSAPVSNGDNMSNYGINGKGSNDGVMITSVRGGSRAARAGLQKGDVIRTVDGNEVMQPNQLNQVFSQVDSAQTIPMLIFRNGNITPIQF